MRILTALPLLALLATPAIAQESTSAAGDTLRVAATADARCVVEDASGSGGTNASFTPDGAGGGTIRITQLVDPETAQPRAAVADIALPVTCNAAHRVYVGSVEGGLLRAGGQRGLLPSASGFGDYLPYTLSFDWGDDSISGASNQQLTTAEQGATHGELRLRVAVEPDEGFLTAGTYSDNVTIRFEPAS